MEYLGLMDFGWTFVMQMISILVLFLILKKFFFEKVHNFVEARQGSIRDAIAGAEALNRKADEKMDNYTRKIANAESEGREIIRASKTKADQQAKLIIDEANQKANQMIVDAEAEIARQKQKAMEDMKSEISEIALLAAAKILEEDIRSDSRQDEIINKVIEESGAGKWQS